MPKRIVPGAFVVLLALLAGGFSAGAQQAASDPPPLTPAASAPVVVQVSPAQGSSGQISSGQVAAAPLGEGVDLSPPYTVVDLPLPPSRRQVEQSHRRVAAARKRRDAVPATPYPPYHVVQAAPARRATPVWITVGNGF